MLHRVITVVGIGADGWASLTESAREAVRTADLLVGGDRQLGLVPDEVAAERRPWPERLQTLVDELPSIAAGRAVVVLASGDPLLHGVGVTILRRLGDEAVTIIPNVSSFSLACARLRWPQAEVELVSATGRIAEVIVPALQPRRRIVVLGSGPATAAEIARVLRERGFGASRLIVLEELGGAGERTEESTAAEWGDRTAAALHLVAIEVRGKGRALARAPGLPDDVYEHDGTITDRHLRAVALAVLAPVPGQLLWDVGAGCGAVAIEWLRAAAGTRAIAIDSDERCALLAARNALKLGVPWLQTVVGSSPDVLDGLGERPDAIYVGGGLTSYGVLTRCRKALARGGRLVAHATSTEAEGLLVRGYAEQGGRLTRLTIAHAEPRDNVTEWRPVMVAQWELRLP
jgi:precorrin-6Y C5,15-methyltransferase (decarboxylating)